MKYTIEKNVLSLVSLLKDYGIKKIVASPGTTNVTFVASVQCDPFFGVYSSVDERSAVYMAIGMALESNEPVVITCTGATASRNYISGLTYAYKHNVPIIAVTAIQHTGRVGNYVAQVLDRSVQYNDMCYDSFLLPFVLEEETYRSNVTKLNMAFNKLLDNKKPLHINMETRYSNEYNIETLPKYRNIDVIKYKDELPQINDKVAIFIGAHKPFTVEEENAITRFCQSYDAVVIGDQTSNYRGEYRTLSNICINQQSNLTIKNFDIMIYIGSISGAYLGVSCKELWRVNIDGEARDYNKKLTKVFKMDEIDFFMNYVNNRKLNSLITKHREEEKMVRSKISNLPFSNIWIAKNTADRLEKNSVLHLGILNTLRSWNFFETDNSIAVYCNTGGFGIDGCLSTAIGAAVSTPNKLHYLIIGDLAFFYDLNSLQLQLPKNLHVMLINNGVGTEFKNYNHKCAQFGCDADAFMAARGHYGNKSDALIKNLANVYNYTYITASNKEDYLKNIDLFINDNNSAVIYEVFTNSEDESNALKIMNTLVVDKKNKVKNLIKKLCKKILPNKIIRILKG